MALVVQKFGGTSVATIDRIKHVAGLIAKTRQAGDTVVVVVSAMSGETDRLVKLAHAIAEFPDEREMDMLLSTGERVVIALLAMSLRAMGFDARSFTGRQVGIITDSTHTKARIERIVADRIQAALDKGIIPVVAGLSGISGQDDVTTLGRGGAGSPAGGARPGPPRAPRAWPSPPCAGVTRGPPTRTRPPRAGRGPP